MQSAWWNKAYIVSGIFFVLRWQSSPTQMKCTCSATNSTYTLYCDFYSELGTIWILFDDYANTYYFHYFCINVKSIRNVPYAKYNYCIFYDQKTPGGIKALDNFVAIFFIM